MITLRIQRKFLTIALFISLTGVFFIPRAEAQTPTGRKIAVLIGVGEYDDENNLRYTVNDINATRDQLIDVGFSKDDVHCLTTSAQDDDGWPSKDNIDEMIEEVLDDTEEGDLVIVMMGGHGMELDGESFFCPSDSGDDAESNVSIDDIFDKMQEADATFKIMIIDACRNDFNADDDETNLTPKGIYRYVSYVTKDKSKAPDIGPFQTINNPPDGFVLLQSCASGEVSREVSDFQHGVFTYFLLKGLDGYADFTGDGTISFLELFKYTENETKKFVAEERGASQRPYLQGTVTDFIIVDHVLWPPDEETSPKELKAKMKEFSGFIKKHPDSSKGWYCRGLTHYYLDETKEAIDDLSHAITLNPHNHNYFLARSRSYKAAGQKKEAKADMEQYEELKSNLDLDDEDDE